MLYELLEEKHCPESQASSCTREKPELGTEPGSHPRPSRSLGKTCGNLLESRCWAHPSGRSNTSRRRWKNASRKKGPCGKPSPRYQTCSAPGRSCSRAQIPEPTTRCAQCHQGPLPRIVRDPGSTKVLLDGLPAADETIETESHQLATLPMRMGGLGLRSAVRCAPAAYWASWADALHMISERTPEVADEVVRRLGQEEPVEGCLGELQAAATELDQKGFWWRPAWAELHAGRRPPQSETREPGEWPHGWQYWASSVFDTHFTRCWHSRNAGVVFSHAPTTVEFTVPPHLFRVLLLERLQLPLPLTEATCNGCHEPKDPLGRHRAACTRTGRIKKRSSPTERVLARVCREAGARVKFNAFLRDMNLGVRGDDERRIEVLAQDLPCFKGAQLAVDITLRSALSASGEAQPGAAEEDGAVLAQARRDKEATYPELLTSRRCRLVVVAIETGRALE